MFIDDAIVLIDAKLIRLQEISFFGLNETIQLIKNKLQNV